MEVVIPYWLAQEIRKRYGSLENYSKQRWDGALMPVDDYWRQLNSETQTRINEMFARRWKRA